jgi:hypothetical protein
VTAYVAPPPALVLGWIVPASRIASKLWQLAVALILLTSVRLLERDLHRESEEALRYWHLTVLGMLPLMFYTILLGQTTAFLMAAVTATVMASSWRRALIGGAALGIASAFKGFPAIMILVAMVLKGRRLAVAAFAVVAILSLVISVVAPPKLWSDFFEVAKLLGTRVAADWNNPSPEAGLVAMTTGRVSSAWTTPPAWIRVVGVVLRSGIISVAVFGYFHMKTASRARRWSLLWIALFSAIPMSWSHYLLCLLPLLQVELKAGRRALPVILSMGLSAGFVAQGKLEPTFVAGLTSLGWLMAAVTLLVLAFRSERCSSG